MVITLSSSPPATLFGTPPPTALATMDMAENMSYGSLAKERGLTPSSLSRPYARANLTASANSSPVRSRDSEGILKALWQG